MGRLLLLAAGWCLLAGAAGGACLLGVFVLFSNVLGVRARRLNGGTEREGV